MIEEQASSAPGDDSSTTERVTLEEYLQSEGDYVIYSLHKATYDFAKPFVKGKKVLDLGCGTGYGCAQIADDAESVDAVDISDLAIRQAEKRFADRKITFTRIQPIEDAPLPFEDASFDVVLSFQVVEHVPDVPAYIAEVRRVLAPGGTFVCVTPERRHRLFPRQRPWNEFHMTEFAPDELRVLLGKRFGHVAVSGMGASEKIIGHELRRYQRMRVLCYPFTFPGAPEKLRLMGIRTAKHFLGRTKSAAPAQDPSSYGFGPQDIRIGPGVTPSVNIVAVATGTDPSRDGAAAQ